MNNWTILEAAMSADYNFTQPVVHVVESFGAGVLEVVRQLANDQCRRGLNVHVIHGHRPDTPTAEVLNSLFSTKVHRHSLSMARGISPLRDLGSLLRLIITLYKLRPCILHLHSSKAGLLGRIASFVLGHINRTIYSPHGWSFLRTDVSPLQQHFFLKLEQLAARFFSCHIAACSEHELDLARTAVGAKKTTLLRNAVATPSTPKHQRDDSHVRVITVGRVTEQKAPWHFARLARELASSHISFQWIGDNQHNLCKIWLGGSPVEQTGLLGREALQQALADADIFVLLSDWEGLPLALIEAQAMGLPALITPLPGCLEVITPEVNGLTADSPEAMHAQLLRLIHDPLLRRRMSTAARNRIEAEFSFDAYSSRVWQLYSKLVTADNSQ